MTKQQPLSASRVTGKAAPNERSPYTIGVSELQASLNFKTAYNNKSSYPKLEDSTDEFGGKTERELFDSPERFTEEMKVQKTNEHQG